jgi:hypothetical protein
MTRPGRYGCTAVSLLSVLLVGPVTLKGLSEPLEVVTLGWR